MRESQTLKKPSSRNRRNYVGRNTDARQRQKGVYRRVGQPSRLLQTGSCFSDCKGNDYDGNLRTDRFLWGF